jgi:drug/metabolite transporter (DMT)-like permease
MPLFIAALAFLLPLAAFLLWRQFRPGETPSGWIVLAAAIGVALVLGGALHYGLNRSIERGERYVPATLTPER